MMFPGSQKFTRRPIAAPIGGIPEIGAWRLAITGRSGLTRIGHPGSRNVAKYGYYEGHQFLEQRGVP